LKNSISRTVFSTIACLLASVLCLASYASSNFVPLYDAWEVAKLKIPDNGGFNHNGWHFERRSAAKPQDNFDEEILADELLDDILFSIRFAGGFIEVGFEHTESPDKNILINTWTAVAPPITLRGLQRIVEKSHPTILRVTYAIPEDQIQPIEIKKEGYVKNLSNYLQNSDVYNLKQVWDSPFKMLDECSFDQRLKKDAVDSLARNFSQGLSYAMLGNKPRTIGILWLRLHRHFSPEEIKQLSDWELFEILNERIGDSFIMKEINSRNKTKGMLVFDFFNNNHSPWDWDAIDLNTLNAEKALVDIELPKSRLLDTILKSGGNILLSNDTATCQYYIHAQALFDQESPDFINALVALINSIDNRPTADNLNLTAACLLELGLPKYAVPVSKMAYSMDRLHKYACVNYIRAIFRDGRESKVITSLIKQINQTVELDEWGTNELNDIESTVVQDISENK